MQIKRKSLFQAFLVKKNCSLKGKIIRNGIILSESFSLL